MFVQINRLTLAPELGERVEHGFKHSTANLAEVPGFVGFRLLRGQPTAEGQAVYLAESTWDSEESYQAWLKSPSFSQAHAGASGRAPIQSALEQYDVVHAVGTIIAE